MRATWRSLIRTPGFTTAALLSLAIGIGANTAIFSVAHAILLRPMPYKNADRLAILWNRSPGLDIAEDWFSTAQYFDIRSAHGGFEALGLAIGANYNLTGGDLQPERIGAIRVSASFLPMLGARPQLGRLFEEAEDHAGRQTVAILSDRFWTRRFGRDASIVGRGITLNGQSVTVIGVLAPGFTLPHEVLPTLGVAEDGDVLLSLPLPDNAPAIRTREDYNIMGVLKRGVSVDAAQAEMDGLTARLRRDYPDVYPPNGGLTFSIVPIQDQVAGKITRPLIVLIGAVGFVLLIACVNVANLLLSRAIGREKELAVRLAIGATRGQIVALLLGEGAMLAAGGAVLGVGLAAMLVRWIHVLQPKDLPRLDAIAINGWVLLFTVLVSAIAALLFSAAPARGAAKVDPNAALSGAARGSSAGGAVWGRGLGSRRLLVTSEIALAVMLLVGAGLLIRSFASLQRVSPGFDPRGVLTLELTLTGQKYRDAPAVIDGYKQLWSRLDAIPGVTASGGVSSLPMSGFFAWGPITVEGRTPAAGEKFINADQRSVAGEYFRAMGIPLVRGRLFDAHDVQPSHVIVIDQLMAESLWPNADPIGKRVKFGDASSTSPWETVVGIVGRVKQYGVDADARMAFYRPHAQSTARALFVTVKTAGDPAALQPAVAAALHAFDPDLPLYHVQTMAGRVGESMARQRFVMTLLVGFAGVALALAAVGIYGVMAYLVTQGTREIGIRVALGAGTGRILSMVFAQGGVIAAAGLSAGVAGALLVANVMRGLLFGVEPRDPLTIAAVIATLAAVALAAIAVPAVRAARLDPVKALARE